MARQNIESIYQLTPLQQGMLFHTLAAPSSGVYLQQWSYLLEGELDEDRFVCSWQRVVERHSALRTAFVWEGVKEPVQVVHRHLKLSLERHDWRSLPVADRRGHLETFLQEDRARDFVLTQAPLMRLALIELDEREHYFVWSHHHLLLDGWSVYLVLAEVIAFYEALAAGRPLELPRRQPYRDYVLWLQRRSRSSAQQYWQRTLAGFSEPTKLGIEQAATARDRPARKGARRGDVRLPAEPFQAFVRRRGLTLNTLVQGVWGLVLNRYSGRGDVVFGAVSSARPPELTGAEHMVGLFINTQPVRVKIEKRIPLANWLKDLQSRQAEQRAYDHTPLVDIQAWSEIPQGRPMFENLLVFESYPISEAGNGSGGKASLKVRELDFEGQNNYPLTLIVEPGHEIVITWVYDQDRFDPHSVDRLRRHFRTLAEGCLERPECRVDELPLLNEVERHQLLAEWNQPAGETSGRGGVHELIEASARHASRAMALVAEERQMSYGELNRRADRLARRLRSLGVGPEVLVAIVMERSPEMVVGMLGVLKTGGAYVPVDPRFPRERQAFILRDTRAPVVLTLERLAAGLPETTTPVLCLDTADLSSERDAATPALADPSLLTAYVIYTSGSTGRPKGVAVEHRQILNYVLAMQDRLAWTAGASFALVQPLAVDSSKTAIFLPLTTGGRLYLVSETRAADSEAFEAYCRHARIDGLKIAPSHLAALLDSASEPEALLPHRWLVIGGEASDRNWARRLLGLASSCTVFNHYGPTEATVGMLTCKLARGRSVAGSSAVAIGRPLGNTGGYVLDRQVQPTPIGVPGELFIAGHCVARGYLGRARLTAGQFLPDPFSRLPGARLYRSGDLTRHLPDGQLEFLGRGDQQVKIRGFRIELGEIESALREHPAVAEAVVEAKGPIGNQRLVAYVAPSQRQPLGEGGDTESRNLLVEELRESLKNRLPEHMVPAFFMLLEALPRTRHGKIDRRALPEPDAAEHGSTEAYVAPRNLVEEMLAGIWGQVLGLDRVGVHDNFFDLGGHSLLITQLMARLQDAFQVELPLRSLVEHSTVAELATAISRHQSGQPGGELPDTPRLVADPEHRYDPFPLSDLQQAYWLGGSEAFELGNVAAHSYREIDFIDLDPELFQRAWQRVVKRHDALRTIVLEDGRQQILEDVPPYRIEAVDLHDKEPEQARSELGRIRHRMAVMGPTTDQWPLFELLISRLDEHRCRLHMSVSLIVSDGWSTWIMSDELSRFYSDPQAELPPLEVSVRDYVMASRGLRDTEARRRSRTYWLNRLESLPPAPELALASRPSEVAHPRFERRPGRLEPELWRRLRSASARSRVTPTAVLCAIYCEVLANWSKSARFTINVLFHNRLPLHPQVADLMGNFSSTNLLEADHRPAEAFEARVKRLQKQLWDDLEHSYFGGVEVVRELNRLRGGSLRAPMPVVFTSTLNLNPRRRPDSQPAPADEDEAVKMGFSALQTPQVWLDHQVFEEGEALAFNWDAVEGLFPPGMVDEMFDAYCRLLHRFSDDRESWREPTPSLVPPGQQQIWAAVNDTEAPVTEQRLHDPFLEQAARRPDHSAVVAPGCRLTYRELDEESRRLAHQLRELGVRPGRLVAVVMEKGWEQIVAVLGVLRSSAAYLPIDPRLPQERVHYLLDHGEVELALVQSRFTQSWQWPEGVHRVTVGPPAPEPAAALAEEPEQDWETLAYTIYTSGSTGQPKGVMIDHRGAVNTVLDVVERFGLGPRDRVLALSSLSFDLSVFDVFGLLAAGGAVVLPDASATREPEHWTELIDREKVTVWNSVPALMEMWVEYLETQPAAAPNSLRRVMLSGDWIPVNLPERIKGLFPGVEVTSLGGATEASIWSILHPIDEVDVSLPSIPYGRPMANQRFSVLNERLEACPVWVPGKLHIGGIGLALGYWRDEEKTRAAFINHPRTGERLYSTGDLGRYLPSGDIEFLGREDFQVKVQGYRIELGEIEAALLEHPGVAGCVVVAVGEREDKRLMGYVVPEGPQAPTSTQLREFLHRKLPEYMVPPALVYLEALPLTSNGKVDRQALAVVPEPSSPGSDAGARTTPRDDIELGLTQIWQEVLETPVVRMDDNFFELGGNSLLAVRLVGRIQRRFGKALVLSVLFEGATIEQLAAILRRHGARPESSVLVAIRANGSRPPFFCVHPVGGSVLCYADLAHRLDREQPFFGLQVVHTEGGRRKAVTLESMAADYREALCSVQPEGPYRLGGWSMGGVVAFEMARQLHEEGKQVAMIVLLDAAVPDNGTGPELDDAALVSRFAHDLGGLAGKELSVAAGELRLLRSEERLNAVLEQGISAEVLPRDVERSQIGQYLEVFKANYRTLLSYVPKTYPGRLDLIRPRESATDRQEDPTLGWRAVATHGVEIHWSSGSHYSMMREPHIDVVAEKLTACFRKADSN